MRECDTCCCSARFRLAAILSEHAKIVQIDIEAAHLGRRHPVTKGVVGDIGTRALMPRLRMKSGRRVPGRLRLAPPQGGGGAGEGRPRRRGTIPHVPHRTDRPDGGRRALVTGDDGTATVWMHRYFEATAKRRFFVSLLHGTMAAAMPTALGLQKAQPGRQVISLSGDGGIGMLLGDLLTAVQHKLPIKVAVFNNGKLGFIDIEQKSEGLAAALHPSAKSGFRRGRKGDGPVGPLPSPRRTSSRQLSVSGSLSRGPLCSM